jgi:hypothetical protein
MLQLSSPVGHDDGRDVAIPTPQESEVLDAQLATYRLQFWSSSERS